MKRLSIAGIILCLFFLVAGCAEVRENLSEAWKSIWGTEEEATAQELAWAGMDLYESGAYKKSIEKFQKIKDFYPFSKYVILAQLKIADAHYKLQEYDDAIFAYEEFEKLHPRNEAIPYVIYQIGRCYFDQISTIDREQTNARQALEQFQRLGKQFPNSKYTRAAREHIDKCLQSLAGHDYIVGLFYYKSKHYKAALYRFRDVIAKYPDVGYHQKALQYIAKCQASLAGK